MNVLNERDPELIKNPGEIIFTPMYNSTCSVIGRISGIGMTEEELIKVVEPDETVVKIDCNFGHKVYPGYTVAPVKKTSRGRKTTAVKPKQRKGQGDKSSFNCMVQFTVPSTCLMYYDDDTARQQNKQEIVEVLDNGLAVCKKIYKIKLFRNGSISIPGCILEDLTDCISPLLQLCKFLERQIGIFPQIESINSVMRNYKFSTIRNHIDLIGLQNYFANQIVGCIQVNFQDVIDFLKRPAFMDIVSPHFDTWDNYIKGVGKIKVEDHKFDITTLENYMVESKRNKSAFITRETLTHLLHSLIPINIYKAVARVVAKFKEITGYYLGNKICELMVHINIANHMETLRKKINKSKDNQIAGFSYDPDRFTALIIKINSPSGTASKKEVDKQTTIKLYAGGKINIDGANNREEATYIYYWLNNLLRDTEDLLYDPNVNYDELDPDDTWSYNDSDLEDPYE